MSDQPAIAPRGEPDGEHRYVKGLARRAQILADAATLFAEVGYHRPTMIDVAERCGISRGGLLRYFPTKEVLLVAVLEERGITTRQPHPTDEGPGTGAAESPDLWSLWKRKGEQADALLDLRASDGDLGGALRELMGWNLADRAYLDLFVSLSAEAAKASHPAHAYFENHYRIVTEWLDQHLAAHPAPPRRHSHTARDEVSGLSASIIAVMDGLQIRFLYDDTFDAAGAFDTFLHSIGLLDR